MQKLKNKTMAILIATLLTISMGTSTLMLPNANAHTPAYNIPTYAYCNVAPNPCGLGLNSNSWILDSNTSTNSCRSTGDRWHNFKVTVTHPDGTTETLGPFTSDDTGGTWTAYTPTKLGNYIFVFDFPGETLAGANRASPNNEYIGDYFEPSTSQPATLQFKKKQYPPFQPFRFQQLSGHDRYNLETVYGRHLLEIGLD